MRFFKNFFEIFLKNIRPLSRQAVSEADEVEKISSVQTNKKSQVQTKRHKSSRRYGK